MSKPTSYQLLKDIHEVTASLERKMDKRIAGNTKKIDTLEGKVDNMLGKIGIGVIIVSAVIAGAISFIFDFFKKKA